MNSVIDTIEKNHNLHILNVCFEYCNCLCCNTGMVCKMADKFVKEDSEVKDFLATWEKEEERKMGDRLEVDFNKLYKVEVQSTFDGVSEDSGSEYTGYRLTEKSPMCPNGVFFLSGVARKTMNEYLQYHWRDPTTPIKVKFVKCEVKKPGKKDYHVIRATTTDKW